MSLAARIGDPHICPQITGFIPHIGGPISSSSTNVYISGQGAARVGDTCICNGPIDSIVSGSNTVRINGRAAARQGDTTAHGGQIAAGALTVHIGG